MKRVTVKEVATKAKVSITTVSHVINETRFVDPNTKQRVLSAMDSLGYQPNFIARSLRSGITKTIGLIVPDIANLFFAEIGRKIEDYGYQQGYSVILGNSDNDPEKQEHYIHTLMAKRVDGVIFISSGGNDRGMLQFSHNHIPIVVMDRNISLDLADVVMLDNETGGYLATSHLIQLGHQKIGCITVPKNFSSSVDRLAGYKRAMQEAGLRVKKELIVNGDFLYSGGETAMSGLLLLADRPTAVFCSNDMMAIGAMSAIRKAGYSIPEDISLVGFDNIELAAAMSPALTTFAQPVDEIARVAVTTLIDRIRGEMNEPNQQIILQGELIVRASTAQRKN